MLKVLSLLPAILSFSGLIYYLFIRNKQSQSPLLHAIIETIKLKSGSLPELDERLSARQVFNLIKTNASLREKLSASDYQILMQIVNADERRSYVYGGIAIAVIAISLFAYIKVAERDTHLTFENVSLKGSFQSSLFDSPTTKDDLVLKWQFNGKSKPVKVLLTQVESNINSEYFEVLASDGELQIKNSIIQNFYGCPSLNDIFSIRVTLQSEDGSSTFGPYKIETALTVLYHVDLDSNKVEIFTQTLNCGLLQKNYEFKILAWPVNGSEPETLTINVVNGKGEMSFPTGFKIDEATLKVMYYGEYPNGLVRFERL
jgi:hypothetical protein